MKKKKKKDYLFKNLKYLIYSIDFDFELWILYIIFFYVMVFMFNFGDVETINDYI